MKPVVPSVLGISSLSVVRVSTSSASAVPVKKIRCTLIPIEKKELAGTMTLEGSSTKQTKKFRCTLIPIERKQHGSTMDLQESSEKRASFRNLTFNTLVPTENKKQGGTMAPGEPSKMPIKKIHSALVPNEKRMIMNAYNYNYKTMSLYEPVKLKKCAVKTAKMLGLSFQTIYRVLRESKTGKGFAAPKKPGPKKSVLDKLDEKTITAMRKKIIDYLSKEEAPTLKKIADILRQDPDLPKYSTSTVRRVLKLLNIKYDTGKRRINRPPKNEKRTEVLWRT